MEQGYIYKLTLLQNTEEFKKGEIYIGKHNGVKPNYWGSGKLLKRIIEKNGKEVFQREIIAKDIDNNELLSYLEIYYIEYYKCNRSITKIGLNLTEGGEGIFGYKRTQKLKDDFSIRMKERYKSGKIRPPREKKVYQYSLTTGELLNEFSNCTEAAKAVDGNNGSISYCARGKCFSSYGYSWLYSKLDYYKPSIQGKIPILQYDLNDNFIQEWESATNVKNELGFNNSAITNCCKGKIKSSYGFKWKYKN